MARLFVTVDLERPEDLLACYYPNGKKGGLTLPGAPPGPLGQRARLTLRIKDPAREFELTALIAWARRKGTKTLQASYGVEFLPEDDAMRARLLGFANHQVDPEALRLASRHHVELSIKVVHGAFTTKEQLADLSTGGAFIRTRDALETGEKVELVVRPPMSLTSVTLKGRVAWVRGGGPQAGMGIEFVDDDGSQRAKIERLIKRVARD